MLRAMAVNVACTSIVLGALHQAGAVKLQPQAIKNEYAQTAFTKCVAAGEIVYTKTSTILDGLGK